ncbi:MAG: NYN domain-containing protein [Rhodothermaceae bacterium]
MKQYIIDGNNLIGKIKELRSLQKKDPQASREKLAFMLDRYFSCKVQKATLHLDGFPAEAIRTTYVKIEYSENKTADENIKFEIEISNNPKLLYVVTSDHNLMEFARVCSSVVIKSENFVKEINSNSRGDVEENLTKDISDDEMRQLFGVTE